MTLASAVAPAELNSFDAANVVCVDFIYGIMQILMRDPAGGETMVKARDDAADRRVVLLPAAVIVLSALAIRLVLMSTTYRYFVDDAYIFGHYANNFAHGRGLVYNPGERVLGYTSPLYVFLLCVLKRLFISVDMQLLTRCLNALLVIPFAAAAAALFARKQVANYAIPIALILYFSYLDGTLNGMETTLMLACIMGVLYALDAGRRDMSVICATAAALVRPEGFLLLFVVLAYWPFVARKRVPCIGLVVAVLMLLAWIIPTYSYFGTVIPQSMVAKSSWRTGVSHSLPAAGVGGQLLRAAMTHTMLSLSVTSNTLGGHQGQALMAACGVGSILFAIGFAVAIRKRTPLVAIGAFYLLFLAMYIVGRPVHIWSWYTVPASVCFAIVALSGMSHMLSARSRAVQYAYVAIVGLICIASICFEMPKRVAQTDHVASRLEYLSDFAKANLPPNSSIMEGDIGILAYRTNMRIIDLGGLVSPQVLPQHEGQPRYFSDLVREERPEMICIEAEIHHQPIMDEVVTQYVAFKHEADKKAFFADYVEIPNKSHMFPQFVYIRADLVRGRKIVYPDPSRYR